MGFFKKLQSELRRGSRVVTGKPVADRPMATVWARLREMINARKTALGIKTKKCQFKDDLAAINCAQLNDVFEDCCGKSHPSQLKEETIKYLKLKVSVPEEKEEMSIPDAAGAAGKALNGLGKLAKQSLDNFVDGLMDKVEQPSEVDKVAESMKLDVKTLSNEERTALLEELSKDSE